MGMIMDADDAARKRDQQGENESQMEWEMRTGKISLGGGTPDDAGWLCGESNYTSNHNARAKRNKEYQY
jgi:hypothetical protein